MSVYFVYRARYHMISYTPQQRRACVGLRLRTFRVTFLLSVKNPWCMVYLYDIYDTGET